ncbi:MAG: ABC transporter ATP-binding protein/permease [Alphaproteobacteria bacterium]|nr:ABC transporter ATP-binding protein/permease [Alphaproteobacteria bacterium]
MRKKSLIAEYGNRKLLVLNYFFMIVTALDGVVIPSIIASLIMAIEQGEVRQLYTNFILGILAYLIIRTGLFLWQIYRQKLIASFNFSVKKQLSDGIFIRNYEINNDSLYSLIVNDFKLLETHYISSYLSLVYCVIFSAISAIYVLVIDFKLGSLFIISSVFPLIVPKCFERKIQRATERWSAMSNDFLKTLRENLDGNFVIRLFDREIVFLKKLLRKLKDVEESNYVMNKLVFVSGWIANLSSGIFTFVPLMIGGYFTIKGSISLSQLMAVYLASDRIISPLLNGINHYNRVKSTYGIRENISNIILNSSVYQDNEQNNTIDNIFPIELKSISLSYGENKVFDNLGLQIHKGDKILLKGESGSGKSSLISILMGLNKNYIGSVTFDNENAENYTTKAKSFKIGYFSQMQFMFDDTIVNNITLGHEYPQDAINLVLQKVKLLGVVNEKGLDFNIGINGENLSGGQNARIALARLLLQEYDLLLLDEFSSSLDKNTHDEIRSVIFNEYDSFIEISHSESISSSGFTKIMNIDNFGINVKMLDKTDAINEIS